MKNIAMFTAIFSVLICGPIYSQTQQGAWEFSLSGNFGSVSGSSETTGVFSAKSESEARAFITLALRPGYYIIDGFTVEPEILWTAVEKDLPGFILSGNIAYNFKIPELNITPFVLAGYGTGNAIPMFQTNLNRLSDKLDIGVLNIGAGLKIFLAEKVALRTEFRYQRYSQEETFGSGTVSYTTKTITNFKTIFFGLSVFLP